jgi:hypothetical protein
LRLPGQNGGLIATRWRWAPLLGAALYALTLLTSGLVDHAQLSHPSETDLFAFNVIVRALAAAGMAVGPAILSLARRGSASPMTPYHPT